MSSQDDKDNKLESHPFFSQNGGVDGAPVASDWIDEDFESLPRANSSTKTLLLVLLTLLAAYFAWSYRSETVYLGSESEVVALGSAEALQHNETYRRDNMWLLPENRYVSVSGMEARASATHDRRFFQLVGSSIIVEVPLDDEGPRIFQGIPTSGDIRQTPTRSVHTLAGRLRSFETLPSRYESVAEYYATRLRRPLCGYEVPAELADYLNYQRGSIRLALLDEQGREPTEAEVEERFSEVGGCINAFLLQDEVPPQHYRYLYALYLVLTLSGIGTAISVLKSFQRSAD